MEDEASPRPAPQAAARAMAATGRAVNDDGAAGSTVIPRDAAPVPDTRALRLLTAIAEGRTNHELAQHTGVPLQTVKNLVSEVLRDLRVPNRTAAVTLGLQQGWLDLTSLRVRRTRTR